MGSFQHMHHSVAFQCDFGFIFLIKKTESSGICGIERKNWIQISWNWTFNCAIFANSMNRYLIIYNKYQRFARGFILFDLSEGNYYFK